MQIRTRYPNALVFPPELPVLGEISNLAGTPGVTSMGLTWTPAANATGHQAEYREGTSGDWLTGGSLLGAAASSTTITGLNSVLHEFRVRATDGTSNNYSNVVSATPQEAIAGNWALDTNLPSGLTLRTYNPHSASWGEDWGYGERAAGTSVTRITDATAPSPITLTGQANDENTGSSVINQNWAGIPDAQSPDFLFWGASAGRNHVYISTVIHMTAQMQPTNEVKLLEWMLLNSANNPSSSFWLGIYPANNIQNATNIPQLTLVSRAGGDTRTLAVAGGLQTPFDQWIKIQYEARISPLRARLWINDVLVQSEQGAGMSFGSSTQFAEYQQGAVWGGGNGVPGPSGARVRYAATAIWTN